MASVDEQYEATFRAAVEAAVREYEDDMSLKTSPLPALIDRITNAARSWAEEKGADRYQDGRTDGWMDGVAAEQASHTCERD